VVIPAFPTMSGADRGVLELVITVSWVLAIFSALYTVVEWKPFGLVRDMGTMFYGYALAYLSLL